MKAELGRVSKRISSFFEISVLEQQPSYQLMLHCKKKVAISMKKSIIDFKLCQFTPDFANQRIKVIGCVIVQFTLQILRWKQRIPKHFINVHILSNEF
jgi:hypothetical protein